MLYVIYANKKYLASEFDVLSDTEGIKCLKFTTVRMHGIKRILQLIVRYLRAFIINRKGLFADYFFNVDFIQNQLPQITEDDNVLFIIENLKELLVLNKEIKCRKKSVFIRNSASTKSAYSRWEYMRYLPKTGMDIYSFDKGDSKYGFKTVKQVYCHNKTLQQLKSTDIQEDVDIVFLGKDKRRAPYLLELKKQFDAENISSYYYIMKDQHSVLLPQLADAYQDEEIPYADTLLITMRGKCILEILQKGQVGMTIRPLEAIFMKKKLMTNDKNILSSPIYHPDNVYVLGHDKRSLRDFLLADYHELPQETINQYDVHHWIKQFMD